VIAAPEQADLAGNARELVALARRFGLGDDAIRRLLEVHL
jgi:hypothetical protein